MFAKLIAPLLLTTGGIVALTVIGRALLMLPLLFI